MIASEGYGPEKVVIIHLFCFALLGIFYIFAERIVAGFCLTETLQHKCKKGGLL